MTQVAANQNTSSMNDDELTKVFNEIDDDGNGYITPREAKKAFRKLADKFNISRVRFYFHLYAEFIYPEFQKVALAHSAASVQSS